MPMRVIGPVASRRPVAHKKTPAVTRRRRVPHRDAR